MTSFEDDLLAELLGEVGKPYEITQKRNYHYVTLEPGFSAKETELREELVRLSEQYLNEASQQNALGDFDIQKLTRPLVFHIRSAAAAEDRDITTLRALSDSLSERFRVFLIAPELKNASLWKESIAPDLKSVLRMAGLVPPNAPDPEIAEALCRAIKDLFEIQLKSSAKFTGGATKANPKTHLNCFSGILEMKGGGVTLGVVVTVEEKVMIPALSQMTGLSSVESHLEAIRNVPCELVNIIAGSARTKLNAKGYAFGTLGLPRLIPPAEQEAFASSYGHSSIELQIASSLGAAWLEIRFYS